MGKYSKAWLSLARTAVSSVFCALSTMIGMAGAAAWTAAMLASPSPSSSMTSVSMTSKLRSASKASRRPMLLQRVTS